MAPTTPPPTIPYTTSAFWSDVSSDSSDDEYDSDSNAIAATTSTDMASSTSVPTPLEDEYDSDTIVVADMRQMPIVPRVRKIFDQLPSNFSRSADGLSTMSFDGDDTDDSNWTEFTLPLDLQNLAALQWDDDLAPKVTPYTLLNPSASPIGLLPQELLLLTFSYLSLCNETVLVSATQEESNVWTCRLEAEKDAKLSKKRKQPVAKKKTPTQHALLRAVSRKFRRAADEAHRSEAMFSFVVHHLPDLQKKKLILNPIPMPTLDLTMIRHAEIEVPLLVETQSPFTGNLSLHTRSVIFTFHAKPNCVVECTNSPLPGASFLSDASKVMAEGFVEIVEAKGRELLEEAAGGRGWVEKVLEVMALGMNFSQRYCGFGTKREWLRVQGEKIAEMKAELPARVDEGSEEAET